MPDSSAAAVSVALLAQCLMMNSTDDVSAAAPAPAIPLEIFIHAVVTYLYANSSRARTPVEHPMQRLVSTLFAATLVVSAAQAAEPEWITESNRHTQILLEVNARYAPESAANLGLEQYDRRSSISNRNSTSGRKRTSPPPSPSSKRRAPA